MSHSLVLRAARACRWPPLTLGTVMLSDERTWDYALARATPAERLQLLVNLGPALLTCTDAGRERLAEQTARLDDADIDPLVVGDPEALPIVRAALALLPTPVRYSLLRDVAFSCVGISSRAWTASSRLVDAAGREKTIEIRLGPDIDVLLILHELAHAFMKPTHAYSQAISVQGEIGLRELAAEQGWADLVERHDRRAETLADALALSWYFAQPEAEALPA